MSSRATRTAVLALLVVVIGLGAFVSLRDEPASEDPTACREEVLPRPSELTDPPAPPEVVLRPVVADLSIAAVAPLDGARVYAGARDGDVRLVDLAAGTSSTVLDLRPLSLEREAGLQGLAVSPDGTRLYVSYTGTGGDANDLVEYAIGDEGAVDAASARTLLSIESPHQHHNLAHLTFGPDGFLYVGVGDGGAPDGDRRADPQDHAQDVGSLRGKILRIDPRPSGGDAYTVPADNPFVGRDGARPEIYVVGFRNPWRFTFDPATGDLWIGDAGQFCSEEVSHLEADDVAAANLGWSGFEGYRAQRDDQQAEGTVAPVHGYTRGEGADGRVRCAVIGGFVYRGSAIEALTGRYVFGDFCSGALEVLDRSGDAVAVQLLAELPEGVFVQTLGQTAAGELLVGTDRGLFVLDPGA